MGPECVSRHPNRWRRIEVRSDRRRSCSRSLNGREWGSERATADLHWEHDGDHQGGGRVVPPGIMGLVSCFGLPRTPCGCGQG
jgi:hypothetical protein